MFRREVTASDNLYGRHNNRRLPPIVGSRRPIYISPPTRFLSAGRAPSAALHDTSLGRAATLSERFPAPKPQKINQHGFRDGRGNWKRQGNDAGDVMHTDDDRPRAGRRRRERRARASAMVRRRRRCPAGGSPLRQHAQSYRCRRHRVGKVLLNGTADVDRHQA